MPFQVRISAKFLDIVSQERITKEEIAEALKAIDEVAKAPKGKIGQHPRVEAITTTNSVWYRLKPKAAKYRVVFSLQRESDYLTVEGIFRRNDSTYNRVRALFDQTPERK